MENRLGFEKIDYLIYFSLKEFLKTTAMFTK